MKINVNEHIKKLRDDDYFMNLIKLRDVVSSACDNYFRKQNSPKVDLYMIASSVSSPMGRSSDSVPIKIKLDKENVNLVDSAQFGMEPLVQKQYEMVYCYLPSFRGEESDERHLTQFYHCEAEMRGNLEKAMKVASGLVKEIVKSVVDGNNAVYKFKKDNFKEASRILEKEFLVISFDEACEILKKEGLTNCVKTKSFGRVMNSKGELAIARIIGKDVLPVWITNFDRGTVPFYQKPDSKNPDKVLNADLIFPSINGGFGGEILGLGQRQDSHDQMLESMKRQVVTNINDYKWYIDLRKDSSYKTTSGFGLGIERILAWLLGISSIADTAIYPVMKGKDNYF